MPNQSVVYTDLYVSGTLGATRFAPPAGSIADAAVLSTANIAASKLQHQHAISIQYAGYASAVNAGQQLLHIVRSTTGTLVAVEGVITTAPTTAAAAFTLDLRKVTSADTGTTVLATGTITWNSTDAVRTVRTATISTVALADNDQLNLVITTTGSTADAAKGLLVTVTLREDA